MLCKSSGVVLLLLSLPTVFCNNWEGVTCIVALAVPPYAGPQHDSVVSGDLHSPFRLLQPVL